MKIATITRDKKGEFPSHAWPGCYPIIYYNLREDVLCPTCANKGVDLDSFDYTPTDYDIFYEGAPVECDCCGTMIDSAYGSPDEPETEDEEQQDEQKPLAPQQCAFCEQPLSGANVYLALQDSQLPLDDLTLYCPTYDLLDAPDGPYEHCYIGDNYSRLRPATWKMRD